MDHIARAIISWTWGLTGKNTHSAIIPQEGGWLKRMGFCISMRQSHKNKSYPKSCSHRQWTIAIGSHTSMKTGWFRRTWSPFLQTVQRRSHGLAFLIRMRQLYISLCLVVIIVELYRGMQSRTAVKVKKNKGTCSSMRSYHREIIRDIRKGNIWHAKHSTRYWWILSTL